jgi:hypothetical protein
MLGPGDHPDRRLASRIVGIIDDDQRGGEGPRHVHATRADQRFQVDVAAGDRRSMAGVGEMSVHDLDEQIWREQAATR